MKYDLIIFDVDGTLAQGYTLDLLPHVQDFFRLAFGAGCNDRPKMAIATNQGGVGMRRWMERGGFGKPEKYPTREDIEKRMELLLAALGVQEEDFSGSPTLPVYVSYSYQTKDGAWAPIPEEARDDPRWSPEWRKPSPGMLVQAMLDAGARPERTLFVGDSPDDRMAAQAAGCRFALAEDFFTREWSGCEALASIA